MPLVPRTERLKNPDLTQVYARNADSEDWTVLLDYSETGGKSGVLCNRQCGIEFSRTD